MVIVSNQQAGHRDFAGTPAQKAEAWLPVSLRETPVSPRNRDTASPNSSRPSLGRLRTVILTGMSRAIVGPPNRDRRPNCFVSEVLSLSPAALAAFSPIQPEAAPFEARVLARFRRAIDVVVGERLVAVVTPEVGNGPFHAVVTALPPLEAGERFVVVQDEDRPWPGTRICLQVERAQVWEPRIGWERMELEHDARLLLAREVMRARTAHGSQVGATAGFEAALERAASALVEALRRDEAVSVATPVATLAGLGPGLTPAGDDVLAGLMLALWAARHPRAIQLCTAIATVAGPRTTRLSRAYLEAACRGEADTRWHALLASLTAGDDGEVARAVDAIAGFGATSGLAMLDGFVRGLTVGDPE